MLLCCCPRFLLDILTSVNAGFFRYSSILRFYRIFRLTDRKSLLFCKYNSEGKR
ncbi:Uncharacterised protein [Prevotella intermedia]|nr:Uncharacterised protein [Prevotella intermedia]